VELLTVRVVPYPNVITVNPIKVVPIGCRDVVVNAVWEAPQFNLQVVVLDAIYAVVPIRSDVTVLWLTLFGRYHTLNYSGSDSRCCTNMIGCCGVAGRKMPVPG
jgi:hypothetical protein